MARRFRIAAVVFFALLVVAFIALWRRSYFHFDLISGPIGSHHYINFASYRGVVRCTYESIDPEFDPVVPWNHGSIPSDPGDPWPLANGGFDIRIDQWFELSLPNWFFAALSLALAALLGLKRNLRFTVRGLLVATTTIAAILGLAVYAL